MIEVVLEETEFEKIAWACCSKFSFIGGHNMIVYHGTSKNNGENILKTRKIMTNQNKNWTDTTEGYVYLSNDIIKALSYGNKSCSTSHLEKIYSCLKLTYLMSC